MVQRWGLRCHWDLLQIGNSERTFKLMIYSKLSLDLLPLWSRFWEFRANNLKSLLQLNHVPVHETHSATVIKIPLMSKTPTLNRRVTQAWVTGLGIRDEDCMLRVSGFGFRVCISGLGFRVWGLWV